jgi:hypothetical protein
MASSAGAAKPVKDLRPSVPPAGTGWHAVIGEECLGIGLTCPWSRRATHDRSRIDVEVVFMDSPGGASLMAAALAAAATTALATAPASTSVSDGELGDGQTAPVYRLNRPRYLASPELSRSPPDMSTLWPEVRRHGLGLGLQLLPRAGRRHADRQGHTHPGTGPDRRHAGRCRLHPQPRDRGGGRIGLGLGRRH